MQFYFPTSEAATQLCAVSLLGLLLIGCGSHDEPPSDSSKRAEAEALAAGTANTLQMPKEPVLPAACSLVTQAEMSAILGISVMAKDRTHSSGSTSCAYEPLTGYSPAVQLTINWDEGTDAMAAAGLMNHREPGITTPFDGVGDQAVSIGPVLWVRVGDDMLEIQFTGVDDAPAMSHKIFDTLKPRLPKRS